MPEYTSHAAGTPCWVDLMSTDVDASIEFYTGLFGWDSEDQFDPDGNRIYTMFRLGGHDVAGLGGVMPGIENPLTVWNSYVATDNVEATVVSVAEAGGQVLMEPLQVMESGRMAVLLDPTGAAISTWQADEHIGAQLAQEPNTWIWTELMTSDVETAKAFYADVFGWTYETAEMPGGMDYTVVAGGDNGLAGIMGRPDNVPDEVPNYWGIYFGVDDVDKAVARAKELGGTEAYPPMDIPTVGRMAGILDPQAGMFSVMTPEAT